ncbi:MAG: hypothetical protein C0610_04435 [Desulfobacteraceae bacterium]|nr:MAG: hypothetical protein C0610_04435 [Desulfobacteraceae bacterium]
MSAAVKESSFKCKLCLENFLVGYTGSKSAGRKQPRDKLPETSSGRAGQAGSRNGAWRKGHGVKVICH